MPLSSRKKCLPILAIAVTFLLAAATVYVWKLVPIGAAYKAKILCSGVFVSHRDPAEILQQELSGPTSVMQEVIDFRSRSVTVSFYGTNIQRAVYREGLGCALLNGASAESLIAQSTGEKKSARDHAGIRKASGTAQELPEQHSGKALSDIVIRAFDEKESDNAGITRAVVIVHDGSIVAEHYARGITAGTALPGWSMSKSIVNALVGILVKEGKLALDQPVRLTEWSGEGDTRRTITLDNLMRMTSGLRFDERSGPFLSDVNAMLLQSRDAAAYAVSQPMEHTPGTVWHYSSGTTVIISRILRDAIGGDAAMYRAFPRERLFEKIGMTGAVMETDASGTFLASSFTYATARGWARFGLLYLQDGMWGGKRILPKGWVAYSARPTPSSPEGRYGAHFWTNRGIGNARLYPKLPPDTFYASGYEGQYIVIIPSRKLVVVRLGFNKLWKPWHMETFVSEVLAALEKT